MKKIVSFLIFCFVINSAKAQNIKDFNFMLGKWQMKTEKGKNTETWVSKGDSLVGESYSYVDSVRTLTESVIIKKIKGTWSFCVTGYEKGNEGTTIFKLISSKNDSLVFENKAHDFPQRIYYVNGDGYLKAWIEGEINGEKKQIYFTYRRVYIGAPKGKYKY